MNNTIYGQVPLEATGNEQEFPCLFSLVPDPYAGGCDESVSVTGPGTLTFPSNNNWNYPNDKACQFTLTAIAGHETAIKFTKFDVSSSSIVQLN